MPIKGEICQFATIIIFLNLFILSDSIICKVNGILFLFRSNMSLAADSGANSPFEPSTSALGSPTGSIKGSSKIDDSFHMDMTLEEQQEWEEQEMANEVDFMKCHIDPAPFQLVEKSSLIKVLNKDVMRVIER